MYETETDLSRLQALLEASIAGAGAFLRSSFEMPEHSLSAAQLVAHLQGGLTVALATVTDRGEPRVAPIGAFFYHGCFYVPTVAEAARTRHVRKRPGLSLTYFEGEGLALIAHGSARVVDAGDADFAELDATQVAIGNPSVTEWSANGVYLQLVADRLYSYARDPGRFPVSDD
jgi:Pyridoxamine 5'-phosphate oxidase